MPDSKMAQQETSKVHQAAKDGDLELLKRLVKDLDDKNPPIDSCTFIKTGKQFVSQEFYNCRTCEFDDDQVVCPVCAQTCHANHDVTYKHFSTEGGFCDCGAGDFGACNAPADYQTPLHLAAAGGHLNILKFYQEILSNMSNVSSKGWTALHFAASTGQIESVKYLLNHISMNIKTPTGITAYDIAKINNHQSTAECFDLWIKENVVVSEILASSNDIESTESEECPVCLEKRPDGENWGLIHGDTVHLGFCETCTKRLECPCECGRADCANVKCPKCRACIEKVIKAVQVKTKQDESCCQICEEKLHNENWGLVHGDSMHFGYCKICANKLKNSKLPKCPDCKSDVKTALRVYN